MVVPHVEGTAALEGSAQDAFQRMNAAFQGSDQCRLLGYHTGRRPMPEQLSNSVDRFYRLAMR